MLKDTHALLSVHLDPFGLLIPHSRGKASNAMSSAGSSTDMTETSVSEVLIHVSSNGNVSFHYQKIMGAPSILLQAPPQNSHSTQGDIVSAAVRTENAFTAYEL